MAKTTFKEKKALIKAGTHTPIYEKGKYQFVDMNTIPHSGVWLSKKQYDALISYEQKLNNKKEESENTEGESTVKPKKRKYKKKAKKAVAQEPVAEEPSSYCIRFEAITNLISEKPSEERVEKLKNSLSKAGIAVLKISVMREE